MDFRRECSGGADWLDAILYDDVLGSIRPALSDEDLRPHEDSDSGHQERAVVGWH